MIAGRQPRRAASRGVGIVELLVGLALGLFVVTGGLLMLAQFTGENRRLLVETRVIQDLRAASDTITRDIRRAGYWDAASSSVWIAGGPAVPPQNAYGGIAASACATASTWVATPTGAATALCYRIALDTNNVADDNERYGVEVEDGVVYTVIDGRAREAITDATSIVITNLVITPSSQVLDAADFCSKTCTSNCPQVVVREFEVLIKGHAPGDATVSRSLRSNVRVRNDHYGGQCPA